MRILAIVILVFCLQPALASTATGIVTKIRASNSSNEIIITIDGKIEEAPRCNESATYIFNVSNNGGKAILELVKLSFLEDAEIRVVGLNTCSRGYDSERVQDVSLTRTAN